LDYKNIIVLLDESGEVIKRGKVRGYPSSLVLDANFTLQKTLPGHLGTAQINKIMKKKINTQKKKRGTHPPPPLFLFSC